MEPDKPEKPEKGKNNFQNTDPPNLLDLEQNMLQLDLESDQSLSDHSSRFSLVGKIISNQIQKLFNVRNILIKAWRVNESFIVRQIEPNIFLFIFDNEEDPLRIFRGRPWSVNYFHLNLKKWDGIQDIKSMDFSRSAFWIRIQKLPFDMYTVKNVINIGKLFPSIICVETDEQGKIKMGNYIRMLVEILVDKALVVGFVIRNGKHAGKEIEFSYERLSDFCYHCGSIKHIVKNCKDPGQISGNYRYGPWLRVTPPHLYRINRPPNIVNNPLPIIPSPASKDFDLCSVESLKFSTQSLAGYETESTVAPHSPRDGLAMELETVQATLENSRHSVNVPVIIREPEFADNKKREKAEEPKGKGKAIAISPPSSPDISPPVSPKSILQGTSSAGPSNQAIHSLATNPGRDLCRPNISDSPLLSGQAAFETSLPANLSQIYQSIAAGHNKYEMIFSGPDLAQALNQLDFIKPINISLEFGPPTPAKRPKDSRDWISDPTPPSKRICLSDISSPLIADIRDTVPAQGSNEDGKLLEKALRKNFRTFIRVKKEKKKKDNTKEKEIDDLSKELKMLPPISTIRTEDVDEAEIEGFFNNESPESENDGGNKDKE